jgi:hypothetical protein
MSAMTIVEITIVAVAVFSIYLLIQEDRAAKRKKEK